MKYPLTNTPPFKVQHYAGSTVGEMLLDPTARWIFNQGGFITSITTTGSSGAATVVNGVLNIPVYSAGGNLDDTLALGGVLTANRTSDLAGFKWTLNNESLVLNNTSNNPAIEIGYTGVTPTNGYTILKINPVITTETTQTPWLINRTNSAQAGHDGNEVVTMGFNVAANATPLIAGQPAMFWAMESNYIPGTRIMEWHQEFANTAGTEWRLSSYTINAVTDAHPDVDYYMTTTRFYVKSPVTGAVQFQVGDFDGSTSNGIILATGAWGMQILMNGSGVSWQDLGGIGAGRGMFFQGFQTYQFGASGLLSVVDNAVTQVKTGPAGAFWPFRIMDTGGHVTDLYNGGASGNLLITDLPAGNFPMIVNLQTHLTTGQSVFQAQNDLGEVGQVYMTSSAYSPFGALGANTAMFRGSSAVGMLLMADASAGTIRFSAGGNNNVSMTVVSTGKLVFSGTTTARAIMNLGVGSAPTSPVDGDIWREDNTNTGIKARVNGITKTFTLA